MSSIATSVTQKHQVIGFEKIKTFFKNEKVQKALKITGVALAALAGMAAGIFLAIYTFPLSIPVAIIISVTGELIAMTSFLVSGLAIQEILKK